jgi:hypothetical protein
MLPLHTPPRHYNGFNLHMLRRAALLGILPLALPLTCAAQTTFRTQTRLVLVSFHVIRDKSYVPDLKASDIVLLEDGHPRDFTIFDSPGGQGKMPLELVLLFDTHHAIPHFWDPAAVFTFVPKWNDGLSTRILKDQQADIRISVYHTRGRHLFRLTTGTADPHRVTTAFGTLLKPMLLKTQSADDIIPLSLPQRRNSVGPGPFTDDYVTSYFVSSESRGWPMEAAIGAMNDVTAAGDRVARLFAMFSEGIGATTTVPQDVGEHALDLGIPLYPVVTNYRNHINGTYPRNLFRLHEFADLATLTGGRKFECPIVDAESLARILEDIRNHGLSQFVVGFVPQSNESPREHSLEIRLASQASGKLEGGKRRAVY